MSTGGMGDAGCVAENSLGCLRDFGQSQVTLENVSDPNEVSDPFLTDEEYNEDLKEKLEDLSNTLNLNLLLQILI